MMCGPLLAAALIGDGSLCKGVGVALAILLPRSGTGGRVAAACACVVPGLRARPKAAGGGVDGCCSPGIAAAGEPQDIGPIPDIEGFWADSRAPAIASRNPRPVGLDGVAGAAFRL